MPDEQEPSYYYPAGAVDIGPITVQRAAGGHAIIDMAGAGQLWLTSADTARELIRAAEWALAILDPDGPADVAQAADIPLPACAKCHALPVHAADGRFCFRCLDVCHEALESDHCCMICATPEEARALGLVRPPEMEPDPACVRCRSAVGPLVKLKHEPGWACVNSGACRRQRETVAAAHEAKAIALADAAKPARSPVRDDDDTIDAAFAAERERWEQVTGGTERTS